MSPRPESDTFAPSTEYVLPLGHLFRVVWRRFWLIALLAVVFCGAGVGLTSMQATEYVASAQVLVGLKQEDDLENTWAVQQSLKPVAAAVDSRPVAEGAVERLDSGVTPGKVLGGLSAKAVPETQFVQVDYSDTDPERAREVANAVGQVFSEQMSEENSGFTGLRATLWEEAVTPNSPASTNPVRNGFLALMLGGFLGLGLAFLLEYLGSNWDSPQKAERVLGVPTLGLIPSRTRGDEGGEPSERLVTSLDPTGPAAEAYRTLRTNLLFGLMDDPPRVIVLTGPGPGEDKSTACANLGVVLANADRNTLIVDCDLRKPVIHEIFGMRNARGLVDVLVGERDFREVYQEPLTTNLKVIPAGIVPPNPTELLSSRRFSEFLNRVREEFDYVLINAPPVQLVSDPAILASQGDGVLLVFDARNTRKGAVRRSIRTLEGDVGANVLGTVMSNSKPQKRATTTKVVPYK